MDAIVLAAVITGVATVSGATIGALVGATKDRSIAELKREIERRASGDRPIRHYMLFWWRGEADWAQDDWNSAREYVAKFQPTCGFFREEARNAEFVTIVGQTSGVDDGAERYLKEAGCKVERLDGQTGEDTAELLRRRVHSGKAFEGGLFRLGY